MDLSELMHPHRAWDPGLDPQADRGYGQPQPGKQLTGVHGQSASSASVSWQGQVRGNPAAEYAALMQARTAEEAGGGTALMPAQLDGNPWQVDFSKPVFETQLKPGPTGPLRYGERS